MSCDATMDAAAQVYEIPAERLRALPEMMF